MTTKSRLTPYHLKGSLGNQHGQFGPNRFKKKKRDRVFQPTIGEDIELKVAQDHTVKTNPSDNRKRRTLIITKTDAQTWGFTLQSYGIQRKDQTDELDTLTYVDYVEYGSPSYIAGMQAGDVILSINGVSMESYDHKSLIEFIRGCPDSIRLVVLFEDCCRKVEHHLKLRKLKKLLAAKMFELKSLENIEKDILEGHDDSLSLRSESHMSLAGDCLDVCPDSPAFTTSFSYGSLPRNFHLRALRAGSCAVDDAVSTHSVSGVSSHSSEGSTDNGSPTISLNPRLDSRYTSLPPDVRSRNGKKPDRPVGNSLFYGDWLKENDDNRRLFPSSSTCNISRDSAVYQTWSAGMKNKNNYRTSTRSIGNSLFYLDSENDEDDYANTSSSTLEYKASDSSLDGIDCEIIDNNSETVKSTGLKQACETEKHNTNNIKRSNNKKCDNKGTVASHDSSRPMECDSVISTMSVEDKVLLNTENSPQDKTANDANLVSNVHNCSPIRPASLPNLQSLLQCDHKTMPGSDNRDSGFDSPVFVNEPMESSDTIEETVSDWMVSESCDMKLTPSSTDVITSTPMSKNNKPLFESPKMRKNTASTGAFEENAPKRWWMFKKQRSSADLSRSMGNLAVNSSPEEFRKSSVGPVSKPFRFPSFKLSRSKIRHSLSRLRNKSASYFISNDDHDGKDKGSKESANRSEASFEIASPDSSFASLVRVQDNDAKSAFNSIEAYATLPRRSSKIKHDKQLSDNTVCIDTNNRTEPLESKSMDKESCVGTGDGISLSENSDKHEEVTVIQTGMHAMDINAADNKNETICYKPKIETGSSETADNSSVMSHTSSVNSDIGENKVSNSGFFDEVMAAIEYTDTKCDFCDNCDISDENLHKNGLNDQTDEGLKENAEVQTDVKSESSELTVKPKMPVAKPRKKKSQKSQQNSPINKPDFIAKEDSFEQIVFSSPNANNSTKHSAINSNNNSINRCSSEREAQNLTKSNSGFCAKEKLMNELSWVSLKPVHSRSSGRFGDLSDSSDGMFKFDKKTVLQYSYNGASSEVNDADIQEKSANHDQDCLDNSAPDDSLPSFADVNSSLQSENSNAGSFGENNNINESSCNKNKVQTSGNDEMHLNKPQNIVEKTPLKSGHSANDTAMYPDNTAPINSGKVSDTAMTQSNKTTSNAFNSLATSSVDGGVSYTAGKTEHVDSWRSVDDVAKSRSDNTSTVFNDCSADSGVSYIGRPGWKSPLAQRQLKKLTLADDKLDLNDVSRETESSHVTVSSKIKFFSRNMMNKSDEFSDDDDDDDDCESSVETGLTPSPSAVKKGGTQKQLKLTSVPQPGSPKRFVIQQKKLSKFQVPESELATEFGSLSMQNVEDRLVRGYPGSGVRYPGSGGGRGYKRRFYTYEEIPAFKYELSVVNNQGDQTWL